MSTRVFSVNGVDKILCDDHKNHRMQAGDKLGVPLGAGAFMFGLAPFPTGDEPCDDCESQETT